MKTFHHLEFKELADPFDGIIARTVFDNEYGVSVVRSQFSYGGKMGLYELAILDNNGEVCYTTPLTDNVIGYLRDIDITEVMIKVQQLPPIKKKPSTRGLFSRLKWIVDYYFIYFLYTDRKIRSYHRYMTKKYGNRYTDLFNNREERSQ